MIKHIPYFFQGLLLASVLLCSGLVPSVSAETQNQHLNLGDAFSFTIEAGKKPTPCIVTVPSVAVGDTIMVMFKPNCNVTIPQNSGSQKNLTSLSYTIKNTKDAPLRISLLKIQPDANICTDDSMTPENGKDFSFEVLPEERRIFIFQVSLLSSSPPSNNVNEEKQDPKPDSGAVLVPEKWESIFGRIQTFFIDDVLTVCEKQIRVSVGSTWGPEGTMDQARITTDNGLFVSLSTGYETRGFRGLRIELEVTYRFQNLNEVYDTTAVGMVTTTPADGSLRQYSLMMTGSYDFYKEENLWGGTLTPFIKSGVGPTIVNLSDVTVGNTLLFKNQTKVEAITYQLMAGLKFRFKWEDAKTVDLDFGYQFFPSSNIEFQTGGNKMTLALENHALVGGLSVAF